MKNSTQILLMSIAVGAILVGVVVYLVVITKQAKEEQELQKEQEKEDEQMKKESQDRMNEQYELDKLARARETGGACSSDSDCNPFLTCEHNICTPKIVHTSQVRRCSDSNDGAFIRGNSKGYATATGDEGITLCPLPDIYNSTKYFYVHGDVKCPNGSKQIGLMRKGMFKSESLMFGGVTVCFAGKDFVPPGTEKYVQLYQNQVKCPASSMKVATLPSDQIDPTTLNNRHKTTSLTVCRLN